jgi:peptidoglycan/LPS O-acetylase OafA/YrhL
MGDSAIQSRSHLSSVQFLRALAATAVVAFHVQKDLVDKFSSGLPVNLDAGAAGVDLFFVISGFVMVHSSELLFGRTNAPATFMLRRIVRIVPLYWLMTSIMLAYVVARGFAQSDASPTLALASYFFVPNLRPSGDFGPLYGIGWTLNFEMFFYLVFGVALMAPRATWVVTVVAASLVALILVGQFTTYLPLPIAYLADPIILEFVYGMMLAMIYRAGLRLSQSAATILLVAALLEFGWFNIAWFDCAASSSSAFNLPRWITYGVPAAQTVAALTLLDRKLAFPYFETLGDASYALYLVHPAVIALVRAVATRGAVDPVAAPWLYFLGLVTLCIGAALLVHRWLEKPMTQGLKRRLDTWLRGTTRILAR